MCISRKLANRRFSEELSGTDQATTPEMDEGNGGKDLFADG